MMLLLLLVVVSIVALVNCATLQDKITFDQHRCEMPVQVNNLPELLQLQVTEIWINNEGNCAKQLDAVFEILRTLQRQNDDISKIKRMKNEPSFMSTIRSVRIYNLFRKVFESTDMSESKRLEMIAVLAASHLTSDQLRRYDVWAKEGRKRRSDFVGRTSKLSDKAKYALRQLAASAPNQKNHYYKRLPIGIRTELRTLLDEPINERS